MLNFYNRGRHCSVDEILIWDLYEIYRRNKIHVYVMTYEDKLEIKRAYPSYFNLNKKGITIK